MIEQARKNDTAGLPNQPEYVHSPAENTPFLPDGSVDMIISGMPCV